MAELMRMDATGQAELVRRGEAKPVELVEAAVERIERMHPELNAVITPMFEQAVDEARGDLPDGPFRGVPFLLKDLGEVEVAGVRFTEGSRLLRNFVPDEDSEHVRRFRRAGLVICGKTNTPEFGILPTTEPAFTGATRNPWDTTRTPGGSSGGSAAAVASRMVPMAHGNDGGGSIRIPASCCGLFGMKPTRARTPMGPHYGDVYSGLVSGHVLTLSVRDSAAVLDATAGPAPGDPYWAPPPRRPFSAEVGADPGSLRIGVLEAAPNGVDVHADCVTAVRDAAALCEELGHAVSEVELSLDAEELQDAFVTVWTAGTAWVLKHWGVRLGRQVAREDVEPLTWALAETGRSFTAGDYLYAWEQLQRTSRVVAAAYDDVDVILTPTLATPPLPLGSFHSPPEQPLNGFFVAGAFVPFTPICNVTGQPAMNVPLHWNDDGLPIGTQFMGRFGDEATLYRLASQLESARGWIDRLPAVHP